MFIEILSAITRLIILFLPAISVTMSFIALRQYMSQNIYGDEDISEHLKQKIHALFDKHNALELKQLALKKISPTYTDLFLAQGKPMITGNSVVLLNEEFVAMLPDDEFEAMVLQTAAYYLHNVTRTWLLTSWVIQATCGIISYGATRYVQNCTFLPTIICTIVHFLLYWNIIAALVGPYINAWYFTYDNVRFSFTLAKQAGHIPGYLNLYNRLYEHTKLPIFLKKITYFKKHG